jgi:hypothetical protein
MYKGHTKFRHMQGEEEAKASLFVPFLSFCVFEDTTKGLDNSIQQSKAGAMDG